MATLTQAEQRVLTLAAYGLRDTQIAAVTERSCSTIHIQMCAALVRLNAQTRAHAVALALTQRQIEFDPTNPPPEVRAAYDLP